MSQKIIKNLNDNLDEIIDKSKSFEEQIKSLKKLEGLKGYWPYKDFGDKELKSKYFKIELADMSNEIDEKLFKQIFGHTPIKLADKLINTTNKEENQIIINSINKNNDKLDNNGCKYILFTNHIYFSEYFLAVELDEKGHTDRDFVFEKKRQKALEKKLGCKFVRINTSNTKSGYDFDYKIGNIEAFIDEFKNKK